MSGYGRQIIVTSVIAVIIALGIGLGAYYLVPPTAQATTTTITILPASSQSVNQTAGLRLQISINASTIVDNPSLNSSETILVSIAEYNVLPELNNVTAGNNWPIGNLSVGGCGSIDPFGIAVFEGYYTSTNISKASSMNLFEVLSCPVEPSPEYYVFEPNSNSATIISYPLYISIAPNGTTTTNHQTYSMQLITDNISLNGYCCRDVPVGGGAFTFGLIPFAAGTYTLAGGDGWGNLIIFHFTVSASNQSP